jgi:hypothetical protein
MTPRRATPGASMPAAVSGPQKTSMSGTSTFSEFGLAAYCTRVTSIASTKRRIVLASRRSTSKSTTSPTGTAMVRGSGSHTPLTHASGSMSLLGHMPVGHGTDAMVPPLCSSAGTVTALVLTSKVWWAGHQLDDHGVVAARDRRAWRAAHVRSSAAMRGDVERSEGRSVGRVDGSMSRRIERNGARERAGSLGYARCRGPFGLADRDPEAVHD